MIVDPQVAVEQHDRAVHVSQSPLHGRRRQRRQRAAGRLGQPRDRLDGDVVLGAHQRLDRRQRTAARDDLAAALGVVLVEAGIAEGALEHAALRRRGAGRGRAA